MAVGNRRHGLGKLPPLVGTLGVGRHRSERLLLVALQPQMATTESLRIKNRKSERLTHRCGLRFKDLKDWGCGEQWEVGGGGALAVQAHANEDVGVPGDGGQTKEGGHFCPPSHCGAQVLARSTFLAPAIGSTTVRSCLLIRQFVFYATLDPFPNPGLTVLGAMLFEIRWIRWIRWIRGAFSGRSFCGRVSVVEGWSFLWAWRLETAATD
jgi:hypothetical protein